MATDWNRLDYLLGAVISVLDNLLIITLLLARLAGKPRMEHWLGILLVSSLLPLGYLFIATILRQRPAIELTWLGLMIVFLIVEFLLDYLLQADFRTVHWAAITYVILLFGATGGMIGIASRAGFGWMLASAVTFIAMFLTAFYQHLKTGI